MLIAAGRLEDASVLLREAVATDPPRHPDARAALARVLLGRGRTEEGLAELRILTEEDPGRAEGWLMLAETLLWLGETGAAEEVLRKGRALAPDDPFLAELAEKCSADKEPAAGASGRPLGKLALKRSVRVEERSRAPRQKGSGSGDSSSPITTPSPFDAYATPPPFDAAEPPADASSSPFEGITPPPFDAVTPPPFDAVSAQGADLSTPSPVDLRTPPPRASATSSSSGVVRTTTPRVGSGPIARTLPAQRPDPIRPRLTAPRGGGRSLERRPRYRGRILIALSVAAVAAGALYLTRTGPHRVAPPPRARWDMPDEIPNRLALGRPSDLRWAEKELAAVNPSADGVAAAFAALAEERALALLEYRDGAAGRVRAALAAADGADRGNAHAGTRAVARAALAIIELGGSPAAEAIPAARTEVDRALLATMRDPRARWLDGTLLALAGDRDGARAALAEAASDPVGPVGAAVALGDLALDGGDLDEASTWYARALERAAGHPRALLGRALVAAERRGLGAPARDALLADLDAAVRDAPALDGFAALVKAALLGNNFREASRLALERVPLDAGRRALAWVALLRADRGEIIEATRLRALLGPAGDPALAATIDAELALARGFPEDALTASGTRGTVRARLVRGRALIDLGRGVDAEAELRAAEGLCPDDPHVKGLHALSQVLAGSERDGALELLARLAASEDATMSTLARLHLGEARLITGDRAGAVAELEAARTDNVQAYRAHVLLASMTMAAFEASAAASDPRKAVAGLAGVEPELRAALEQSPELLPARALLGRYLAATGQHAAAIAALDPVAAAGRATAADELALANALLAGGDRDRARQALHRATEKGADPKGIKALASRLEK